jgi:hypothetical protein
MVTDQKFQWCTVDAGARKVPVWLRSAALAPDGTVFVPAAIAGSEMDTLLSAAYDGTTMVKSDGHIYVPADWLKREYPKTAELVAKIEHGVREFFA